LLERRGWPGKAVGDQLIEQMDELVVAFEPQVVIDEIGRIAGEQVGDGGEVLGTDGASQQGDADAHAWFTGALGALVRN